MKKSESAGPGLHQDLSKSTDILCGIISPSCFQVYRTVVVSYIHLSLFLSFICCSLLSTSLILIIFFVIINIFFAILLHVAYNMNIAAMSTFHHWYKLMVFIYCVHFHWNHILILTVIWKFVNCLKVNINIISSFLAIQLNKIMYILKKIKYYENAVINCNICLWI